MDNNEGYEDKGKKMTEKARKKAEKKERLKRKIENDKNERLR